MMFAQASWAKRFFARNESYFLKMLINLNCGIENTRKTRNCIKTL